MGGRERGRYTLQLQSGGPFEANTLSFSLGKTAQKWAPLIEVSVLNYSTSRNVCHADRVPVPPQRLPDMLHASNQSDHSRAGFSVWKYHLPPCHYAN